MANSDIEKYGLIGKNISYSFSKKYFTEKFLEENLPNNCNLWVASLDEKLNEKDYIVPGLGDAGDLAYGNKL